MKTSLTTVPLFAAAILLSTLPAATAAPSSGFTPAEQKLLAAVSPGYQASDCVPASTAGKKLMLAAIICTNDSAGFPDRTQYTLYASEADLDKAFDSTMAVDVAEPNCAGHPNPSTWGRGQIKNLGRIGCGTYKGKSEVLWTNSSTLVLSIAQGQDIGGLIDWWTSKG